MTSERLAAGIEARRRVLGDELVDKNMGGADDFDRPFQELMTEYCWGEIWAGGTLSDTQRSLNCISMLTALGRPDQLKVHVGGALRNGCSVEEIRDTLLQATVYCGVPAGGVAFKVAGEVIRAHIANGGADTD